MIYKDIIIDNNSEDFIERVMRENIWDREYTLRVIEEYKKFVFLGTFRSVSPSQPIDQVWHTHLLFSKDYEDMCRLIGMKFHHNPTKSSEKITRTRDPYLDTKDFYKEFFGYYPPEDIWTDWKHTNYVYIDLNTNWVVSNKNYRLLLKLLIKTLCGNGLKIFSKRKDKHQ